MTDCEYGVFVTYAGSTFKEVKGFFAWLTSGGDVTWFADPPEDVKEHMFAYGANAAFYVDCGEDERRWLVGDRWAIERVLKRLPRFRYFAAKGRKTT